MADNVVSWPGCKPTKVILEEALEEDYELVVIVGVTRDESAWAFKSNMANETGIFYLEKAKYTILRGLDND